MQHYSYPAQRPLRRGKINPIIFGSYAVSDLNWGLGDHMFREIPKRVPMNANIQSAYDEIERGHFRRKHLVSILYFSFTQNPWEGLHALIHFLRDILGKSLLGRIFGFLRKPRILKRPPVFENHIEGPWNDNP